MKAITELSALSVVVSMPEIQEVDFSGNPCSSLRRYRDYIIGVAPPSLETIDEVPVPKHQQVAIKGLQAHRERIGANLSMSVSAPPSVAEDEPSVGSFRSTSERGDGEELSSPVSEGGRREATPGDRTDVSETTRGSSWDEDDDVPEHDDEASN